MAKIYRFIFSALLLCASFAGKGQTVDGKLYTIFNNWYQWSGGKFNTNLNIPKVTATTGRDTGGIRYALADSSVYVWTGSQWYKVGGSNLTFLNGLIKTGDSVKLGGTLTENTTINGQKRELNINNSNIIFTDTLGNRTAEFGRTGISGGIAGISAIFGRSIDGTKLGRVSASGGVFAYSYMDAINSSNGRSSKLEVFSDSLSFTGNSGRMNIASMETTTDTITHKPMVYDISTKRWKYITSWPNTDTATVVKAYVTNAEAVTITKGQVVYIFGASGDRASVKLAKNTSDTFSSKTLGIVRADIAAGAAGWITTQGQVGGINLGAYSPGDILWLDSVAGGFTATKPQAPYHSVFVGVVERANAGNGLIYVKPANGVELDELHDIRITSIANNDIIRYNSTLGYWENKNQSIFAYTAQTTTYNALASDYVIHCTSGTFTVNLPTAVGVQGKVYIVKNSGSGLITIDPNGTQTIDGALTYKIGGNESLKLMSTGANWITL
jgi:hypothetical protein